MSDVNILDTRVISAHNIESAWLASTAVIMKGEVCYTVEPTVGEGDKFKIAGIKIGDGIHKWSELPYQTFDNNDTLYKLGAIVSTASDATTFSTTTYLQSNDGAGGTAYSNSSSAVLTIPGVSASGAGLMSTADKAKLDNYGNLTTVINTPTSTSTNIPSDYAVKKYTDDAIADLGKPMHYKGTVTTASGLPSTAGIGDTYKVAEKGNYGTPATAAKVGDMFILNESSAWDYIPSADDDVVISVGSANKWITTSGSASAVLIGHETTGIATTGVVGNTTNVPVITIDEAGHVTSATTAAIPSATTGVEGLTKKPKSGTTSVIDVDSDNVISHKTSGATAGTYGGTTSVAQVTIDSYGHVTSAKNIGIAFPEDKHTYLTTGSLTNTPATDSIEIGIQTSGTSAVKTTTTVTSASLTQAGVMTTSQVATLNKVVSATTAVEGLTKKPQSGTTAVIDVDANNVISHKESGVTAGDYGDATHVFMATVDSYGHITSATTAQIPTATTAISGLTKKPQGDGTWINVNADNKITHIGPGTATTSYGGSASIPVISIDAKGHVSSVSTVANQDYYTTGVTTANTATNYTVQFDRNDGANRYSFTIPEATELLAGVSSTVSTDRLRNGSKVLVLNGNFPLT